MTEKPLFDGKDWAKIAADMELTFTRLFHDAVLPLQFAIKHATNPATSLIALEQYADLLHGGAYLGLRSNRPFYHPFVQQQIGAAGNWLYQLGGSLTGTGPKIWLPPRADDTFYYFDSGVKVARNLVTFDALTGTARWTSGGGVVTAPLVQIAFPPGASVHQMELIIDADMPHVFPWKLLSDEAFYHTKEWVALILGEKLITGLSSAVKTVVEAPLQAFTSRGAQIGQTERSLIARTAELEEEA